MDRNAAVKTSCRITHSRSLAVPCSHPGMAPSHMHAVLTHTHSQRHIRLMAIVGLMPPDISSVPECDGGGGRQLLGTPMPSPAPPGRSAQILVSRPPPSPRARKDPQSLRRMPAIVH